MLEADCLIKQWEGAYIIHYLVVPPGSLRTNIM